MGKKIFFFDTTLRDGEQSPGCSMNLKEKIQMAKQLEKLNMDVIEAGFAASSPGDFQAVKSVAEEIKNCTVAVLARTVQGDIDKGWEAIKNAANPRIHTFIATSDIHMKYKLKLSAEQVMERAVEMVAYAKKYCGDIEFSAEDATRSDPVFLAKIFDKVIKAGATTINIPDTVGYTTPDEFTEFILKIKNASKYLDNVNISVHCHNDLGLAVANTLAASKVGAVQFECTINGIGERAGNAALEELAMILDVRRDIYNLDFNIDTRQIMKTSNLLSRITGVQVQPNKAIVGANAFAHESGIHQHGVINNKKTYEIMTPESIGLTTNKMVMGKHSGRHAFKERIQSLGYELNKEELEIAFKQFKELADKKKEVFNRDIEAIVSKRAIEVKEIYKLSKYVINSGNTITSTATVMLSTEEDKIENVATGDGPVDAAFNAIEKIVNLETVLIDYSLQSVTEGNDALGDVVVKLKYKGSIYKGRGLSTDIVEASVKAYIYAVNKILNEKQMGVADE
ncbi:MAG: 2-isopropylmalate synthase [Eubacteriaceae bacterium]